jgi:hypothetical protein
MTTEKKSWRFRLADWLEAKAMGMGAKKQEMKSEREFRKKWTSKEEPIEENKEQEKG